MIKRLVSEFHQTPPFLTQSYSWEHYTVTSPPIPLMSKKKIHVRSDILFGLIAVGIV